MKNKKSLKFLWGLLIFLIAAVLVAVLSYQQSLGFFKAYDVTGMQGLAIVNTPTLELDAQGTPITPATQAVPDQLAGPKPQPWDGASRVNMLVMGLDYGDWAEDREGPSRTDTMIVLTVDPLALTAGMINIPRDLWVTIPGFENGRINTAYYLGEAYRLEGGGPGLAIKTVEQLLGVKIHYYAQIDFAAFEKFIDAIGGVLIDVPYEISIDPIGNNNTIILQPGQHRLYGPEALAYARARHTEGGDFDRAQRTQQVIMEVRRRVTKPSFFPVLLGQANQLYTELSSGIHTNMTLDEAIQFAWLVQQIPVESIRQGTIAPPEQVLLTKSPDGSQEILKPVPDKIRLLRDEIFGTGDNLSPIAETGEAVDLAKSEGAQVMVLNGTYVEGIATRTQAYLVSQGLANISTGNAGEQTASTKIIDHTGNPYTLRYLVELMNISENYIYLRYDPNSQVDVEVILGTDWADNNSMP